MRTLLTATLCCGLSATALADFTLFGLLEDKSEAHIQQRVPSDTPLLAAGKLDADVSLAHANPTQDLSDLQALMTAEMSAELANAIQILLTRTSDAIYVPEKRAEVSMQADSFIAFYFDGLHPVFRYELDKNGALDTTLADTGFVQSDDVEGYQVYRLHLEGDAEHISVDVAVNELEVVWTLGLTERADQRLKEILIEKEAPLADSNRLTKLQEDNDYVGVALEVDFQQLADHIWQGNLSKLGQDMISLELAQLDDFAEPDFLACEQDIKAIIAGVPRLIAGHTELTQSTAVNSTLIEFADGDLLSQFELLQGQLPDYQQGIVGFGLGTNLAQIAPVVSAISKRFVNQPYTCPALEEARSEFDPASMAQIATATAFVQGIEGIYANLTQVTPLKSGKYEVSGSITLVGQNLGNILAPVGLFTGINVPILSEQSPTGELSIPDNEFVANKSATMSLADDRIVIAFGEEPSDAVLNAPLQDAFNSIYVDHQQTADLVDVLSKTLPINDASTCYDMVQFGEQFSRIGDRSTAITTITRKGIQSVSVTESNANPEPTLDQIAGDYQVSEMTDDCAWVPAGSETLSDDGTGLYQNNEYQQSYQWKNEGVVLKFSEIKACEGDSCDENIGDDECTIVNRTADSFDCLYSDGQEFILRYQRQ